MPGIERPREGRKVILALALAAILGGCAKGGDATPFSNAFPILGGAAPPAPAADGPRPGFTARVECPSVSTPEGTAALRVPSNAPAPSVRYQFSLGDLVRECSVENNQVAIRVGVSGYVLAGPAGGAGTFTVPVRVAIRRESDEKTVVSKIFRVAATIPAGGAQAPFTLVADPLLVPYLRPEADRDYSVLVGFDEGGAKLGVDTSSAPKRRKRG